MPRSGILDASVGPMFTKQALNALVIDFFIIQNTAIMEELR